VKKSWEVSSGFHPGILRRLEAGLKSGAMQKSIGGEARMDAAVTTPDQRHQSGTQATLQDSEASDYRMWARQRLGP
jgi:hypothetical protein